jgi:glutaredoxin 3
MPKSVKVYSTSTCPFCVRAKQFLKDNNIMFENIDVSADQGKAQEMMDRSGQMGVPVLDIDGEIIIGFDKEKIKKVLGIG